MMGFWNAVASLDHMQTICILLQTRNHINTSSLISTGWMLFLMPNQQCQSTEGKETTN